MGRGIITYVACILWLSWAEVRPQVLFLDVGQGDAAVVSARGVHGLVDAGPSWKEASLARHIALQLAGVGIRALDFMVLSHGDRDHWGGMPGLLRRFAVGEVWLHPQSLERIPRVRAAALAEGVPIRLIRGPQHSEGPGLRWKVIPLFGRRSNDRGLALLWEALGCRFLFVGDLEQAGEAALLPQLVGTVDVLKVGHHGSHTSSSEALLAALRPRWGVISSGANNPYGHPHPKALARLRHHGVEVLRTDFHGYVRFWLEQGSLKCETAEGPCGVHQCARPSEGPTGDSSAW